MKIRDRIRSLRRVKASELRPHPQNWRTHPEAQRTALRDLLAEIGYADVVLARELPDKTLELIDGHLRAEEAGDGKIPVLVLDLTDDEARKLLATLDPLAGMAEADPEAIDGLIQQIDTESEAIRGLLASLVDQAAADDQAEPPAEPDAESNRDDPLPEQFSVVVDCQDEDDQKQLYEKLQAEGRTCRLLTL